MRLRRATLADQAAIIDLVRAARINPTGLAWKRFWVIEDAGTIVATGQLKPHGDGSLELASLAVVPSYQDRRLGSALIYALLASCPQPPFLICRRELGAYYRCYGFVALPPVQAPPHLRPFARMIAWVAALCGHPSPMLVMQWQPTRPSR
ncbi:MAG: hypothetical protein Fur005_26300 [Roseiflexaceae bacterium]